MNTALRNPFMLQEDTTSLPPIRPSGSSRRWTRVEEAKESDERVRKDGEGGGGSAREDKRERERKGGGRES